MADLLDRLKAALADRYAIVEELGAGGMATVYLAEDLKHHRKVAVKVLRPELAAILGGERFLREIEIAANLNHPHILPLHDSGHADGFLFYVMPFVEGESLREKLNREKQLAIDDAIRITQQVASALDYAHRRGVIHRDIKPENVMLHEGEATVMDFGIALAVSAAGGTRITETGLSLGTPQYMSPEQAHAERELDGRSDVYALGCVLYEMLAGEAPFTGLTAQAVMAKHTLDAVPPVRTTRPTVSRALEEAITRALAKVPADRFAGAADFSDAVGSVSGPAGLGSGAGPSRASSDPGSARRRRTRYAVVGGAFGLALAMTVVLVMGSPSSLDRGRIAVTPFENRTDDPSVDDYGRLAAEWVARGISRTGILEVAPIDVAREFWQSSDVAEVRSVEGLGERTGAASVVSGWYTVIGQALQFHTQIVDARSGGVIALLEPVVGPPDSVEAVIGVLTDRVRGAVAVHFAPDDRTREAARVQVPPPNYEAFRLVERGYELFARSQFPEALSFFYRAITIDSTYPLAIHGAAVTNINVGGPESLAKAESLLVFLASLRDRLTAAELARRDYILAWLHGNIEAQYDAIRQYYSHDPGAVIVLEVALGALRNNLPQKAAELFAAGDPVTNDPDWWGHWEMWSAAYHRLAKYRDEFEVAREARELFPERLDVLDLEIRANAALGNLEEINRLVDEGLSMPPPGTPGRSMRLAALELRAHGHADAAASMVARAITWLEDQQAEESDSLQGELAQALYAAGRLDDAKELFETLSWESPETVDNKGHLGVIAARQDDEVRAQQLSDELEELAEDREYLFGSHTRWRARIAAVLGDHVGAVRLLRQSNDEGAYYGVWIHTDAAFESVRNDPAFRQEVRPKGP